MKLKNARFGMCILLPGAMIFGSGTACSQSYPSKPIRVLTSEAGTSLDFGARLIAQSISPSLGQPVIADNRAGLIAVETTAKAPPDGHVLLFQGSILWLGPFLQTTASWDPIRDFSPISLAVSSPLALCVNPSLPARSVKDLISLAKNAPGKLDYASGGTGSSTHIAAELFKAMAGVNIVRIPFKSITPALTDVVSGRVMLIFAVVTTATPLVKAGKLRALAITSPQPSSLFPGLPTIAASGVPGYQSATTYGMFAPARTAEDIIRRLNMEIVRALNTPDVKEKFFNAGAETVASSPDQLAAVIRSEMNVMGKVIKDAGIRQQ